ncbi:hypothetical protein AAFN85_06365 [Mucilaginibacter sp. CAU 1740]|uniref:hypothetical protein n=1 Tax=Mucilaginibacter sp. CAU 1740 TaxID=3140365 RepID=UPI00325A534C
MNDYKDDIDRSDSNIKEERESGNANITNAGDIKQIGNLETKGSQKKPFNVLNEDGSLADLPDQDVEGAGAGDGTIGAH